MDKREKKERDLPQGFALSRAWEMVDIEREAPCQSRSAHKQDVNETAP